MEFRTENSFGVYAQLPWVPEGLFVFVLFCGDSERQSRDRERPLVHDRLSFTIARGGGGGGGWGGEEMGYIGIPPGRPDSFPLDLLRSVEECNFTSDFLNQFSFPCEGYID